MAIMIRENKEIRGISILGNEYRILQYADDTALLLDFSENSLKNALSLIEQFSKFSGLKPNYLKTSCIKIGSTRDSNITLCKNYKLTWSQEPFKFLGITFSVDLNEMEELNYEPKKQEISNLIKSWSKRLLSTNGRITVVKTIMFPKLTHLFLALPNPNEKRLKDFERMFFLYIWNNKNDKVARKTIIQDYKNGGLRMVCLQSFIRSLKITWIRRLLNNKTDSSWQTLLLSNLPKHFESFLKFGSSYLKDLVKTAHNLFWKDVFLSFYELMKLLEPEQNTYKSLWFNDEIAVNGKHYVITNGWIKEYISFMICWI